MCFPTVFAQDPESIGTLRQMGQAFSDIVEKTSPAVVWIKTETVVTQPDFFGQSPFDDDFFEFFFGPNSKRRMPQREPRKSVQTAQGSGFIITEDGYILTNNHVVQGADEITVILTDERKFKAKVIGTDPESEVAVIKIDADNLPTLELADSDAIQVGQWVLAIGNPFGLSHTVTAGIISAKGRSVGMTTYENYIQTDAAINPGNSGGPLINLDGQVIGINTLIISRSGGNMGIGLAIPINMAKSVYDDLLESGTVSRGYLGVMPQQLDPDLAKSLGLDEDTKGIILTKVTEDSAADKAGLEQGDVIVQFNGKKVDKVSQFRAEVAKVKPGTEVEVVYLREGKKKTIQIVLDERPSQQVPKEADSKTIEKIGITVQDLTDEIAKSLNYEGSYGVVVTQVKPASPASRQGIRQGFLILQVDRKEIKNTSEFYKAVNEAAEDGNILLLVYNGRYSQYVAITLHQE